ncbi:MAG: hypothetical protein KatS3mg111_3355 [Pirellulaceae bacterium]|nr:MAG: hypothetical protein KatS3mg111_3355 [Pirellulaceae bacterium]
MDAKREQLKKKFEHHFEQATRLAAEIQALEQGDQVPHFDDIELPAHELGQRFSRGIQEKRAREVALKKPDKASCPHCRRKYPVEIEVRTVHSMDGPIELAEPVAYCRRCRRRFFPSAFCNGVR